MYMFGISGWIGFCWWVFHMLYYVRNYQQMKGADGNDTVPLFWFWALLEDANYGWMAWSYFISFFGHILVSLVEVIAWSFVWVGQPEWLNWWT